MCQVRAAEKAVRSTCERCHGKKSALKRSWYCWKCARILKRAALAARK